MRLRPLYAYRYCEKILVHKWPALEPFIRPSKDLWAKYEALHAPRNYSGAMHPDGYPRLNFGTRDKIYAEMPGERGQWLPKTVETVKYGFAWAGRDMVCHPLTDEFIASVYRQFVTRAVNRGGRVETSADYNNPFGLPQETDRIARARRVLEEMRLSETRYPRAEIDPATGNARIVTNGHAPHYGNHPARARPVAWEQAAEQVSYYTYAGGGGSGRTTEAQLRDQMANRVAREQERQFVAQGSQTGRWSSDRDTPVVMNARQVSANTPDGPLTVERIEHARRIMASVYPRGTLATFEGVTFIEETEVQPVPEDLTPTPPDDIDFEEDDDFEPEDRD